MCLRKTYVGNEFHVVNHVLVAFALLSQASEINVVFSGTHFDEILNYITL